MSRSSLNEWQVEWDGVNLAWFLPVPPADQRLHVGPGQPWDTTAAKVHDELRERLPPSVLEHSIRTARLARKLAAAHAQDTERAEIAGLVHDLAEGYNDAQLISLAQKYGVAIGPTEAAVPRLLHGPVGAEILRVEWGVADEEILTAVREHAAGAIDSSPMAKMLFLADKLDAERDDAFSEGAECEALAQQDLDAALLRVASRRIEALVANHRLINERFVAARNRLLLAAATSA